MMARLTAGDLADDVCKRIEAATGLGMMFELRADRPHLSKWVAEKFLHGEALKRFEPVTVYDCCCGSGTMLLAVAEIMPQWMINYNLVQFYGQDIDYHCVLMARINFMLFGLNGYAGKMAIAAYELANAVGRGS